MSVKGSRELSQALKRLGGAAGGKALRSAARSAMLPVKKRAQAYAPQRDASGAPRKTYKGRIAAPGFLSRNIIVKTLRTRARNYAHIRVGPNAEAYYGTVFVERGTRYQAAQEWLTPAFQASLTEVDDRLKIRIRALLDKAARKK